MIEGTRGHRCHHPQRLALPIGQIQARQLVRQRTNITTRKIHTHPDAATPQRLHRRRAQPLLATGGPLGNPRDARPAASTLRSRPLRRRRRRRCVAWLSRTLSEDPTSTTKPRNRGPRPAPTTPRNRNPPPHHHHDRGHVRSPLPSPATPRSPHRTNPGPPTCPPTNQHHHSKNPYTPRRRHPPTVTPRHAQPLLATGGPLGNPRRRKTCSVTLR